MKDKWQKVNCPKCANELYWVYIRNEDQHYKKVGNNLYCKKCKTFQELTTRELALV